MKLTHKHFRALKWHSFRHRLSRQKCIDEFHSLYSDKAHIAVKTGVMNSFVDDVRSSTTFVEEDIDAVHELIKQDCHVTCEIEATLHFRFTSIHSVLHERLNGRKI